VLVSLLTNERFPALTTFRLMFEYPLVYALLRSFEDDEDTALSRRAKTSYVAAMDRCRYDGVNAPYCAARGFEKPRHGRIPSIFL
jgi:hypothetical protein